MTLLSPIQIGFLMPRRSRISRITIGSVNELSGAV
jgi:hypothetical protein